jgi:hypothetical protein
MEDWRQLSLVHSPVVERPTTDHRSWMLVKIRNRQSAIRNRKSAIENPKSEIRNPQSKIRNPKSAID